MLKFMTRGEVANRLGVSVSRVRQLEDEGVLAPVARAGALGLSAAHQCGMLPRPDQDIARQGIDSIRRQKVQDR